MGSNKSELQKAEVALQRLLDKAADLEVRIAKQKRKVALLTELENDSEDSHASAALVSGITDACKTAIYSASGWLSPTDVRDRVLALGFPKQKNLLPSIHAILKRLVASGQIRERDGLYARQLTLGERMRGIR